MLKLDQEYLDDLQKTFFIPSPPELLLQAQALVQAPDPELSALADLVARDLGLSSAILKTINSAQFGFGRVVSDVKQAVMMLGLDATLAVLTAVMLKQSFNGKSAISFERLWDESTEVAGIMVYLGRRIKDEVPQENLYTTGLFHDCGIAAMAMRYHDTYLECIRAANADDEVSLAVYEDQFYNTSHPVVGFLIANTWNLPTDICHVILNHHNLEYLSYNTDYEENMLLAALKIADNLYRQLTLAKDDHQWQTHRQQYFEQLGMMEHDYLDILEELMDVRARSTEAE
ncbi:HDOD domain-containing protein [Bacterioplanes sanyensis]|uniref:HDOD domain-containing protein n=1 Tax=Bacterioplanes sanyensis TaxID=1249553 RepID=UPI001676CCAF|nr:HDOD domain-containing protein [Bacterioplanes sanyensis]GGY32978.1 HDOD domain-containing protein [Bacterioplanes sanyensis]